MINFIKAIDADELLPVVVPLNLIALINAINIERIWVTCIQRQRWLTNLKLCLLYDDMDESSSEVCDERVWTAFEDENKLLTEIEKFLLGWLKDIEQRAERERENANNNKQLFITNLMSMTNHHTFLLYPELRRLRLT